MTSRVDRSPAITDPFIGRDPEISLLLHGLDQARDGRGQLFLIGGEPGIGKSRLANEFAARARERGSRVLLGRAWEGGGAPAYWPWIQVLRGYLRDLPAELAERQLGPGIADLAQILPEIRTLVPDLPAGAGDSDAARFQLFDSIAALLRRVAAERELVLVLEDLHAADAATVLLLRFVDRESVV